MFLPIDELPGTSLRPDDSAIRPSDWAVLANFWYPIAIAADVGDRPVAARLLDVELVLYRTEQGVTVALDLCPHRHIRLSTGKIVEGEIECPFHGLRFDGMGQCQRVPALGRKAKLPGSYRLTTFPVKELYGLVWTCIGDAPAQELPDIPTIAGCDPADLTYGTPSIWPISAPRQVENFFDLAHLPFVHAATLGGDPERGLTPGRVEHTNDAVTLHAHYHEARADGSARPSTYRYRVVLPFNVEFTAVDDEDPDHVLRSSDFAVPISAHQCLVFQVHRAPGTREERQGLIRALDKVNQEDIVTLSGLARPDLPLGHRHEIHLPVDNISREYRARLHALGLGKGMEKVA